MDPHSTSQRQDAQHDAHQQTVRSRVERERPVHLRGRYLLLVCLGGVIGTAARESITLAVPDVNGFTLAIFLVNMLGAFVLGVLLESLLRRGVDHGSRRLVRLLLGTGLLGGFTTYSALAADAALLVGSDQWWIGPVYGLVTVVLGGAASWCGIWLGATGYRSRSARARARARAAGEPGDEAGGAR